MFLLRVLAFEVICNELYLKGVTAEQFLTSRQKCLQVQGLRRMQLQLTYL